MNKKNTFTEEQVNNLNEFQSSGRFHPFTCDGRDSPNCKRNKSYQDRRKGIEIPFTNENEGVLIATSNGWVCPCGDYTQDWAHQFMSERK